MGYYRYTPKCRDRIVASIDNFDLADIWRVFNPSLRQYMAFLQQICNFFKTGLLSCIKFIFKSNKQM